MLRTRMAWVVAWIVLWCAAPAQAQTTRLVIGTESRTIADSGTGSPATSTFTPLTSHVAITCSDADGCAVTLGESGMPGPTVNGRVASMVVTLTNMSANAVTLADTAGVQELQSSISLAQYASTTCTYEATTWVCGSAGGGAGTVTTTGSPVSGNLAFFSGASSITSGNLSGIVTTSGTGVTSLVNNAITNAGLRDSGALSVIGRSANSSGDPADISASAASGAVLRESGSTLAFGTIATAGIADAAVTLPKIVDASAATRILCRGSAGGSGDWEECTLGTAMSMAGTVISSTATGTAGGDVTGPASSTDNAVVRFDGAGGKTIQSISNTLLSDAGAFTFADGVKQTFNPDGTTAGINVGSQAGDPSAPANGDLWYDSTANTLDARINGATVSLGAGGGLSSSTYLLYQDQKAQNTSGGTCTSGAWRTRTINTEVSDTGGLGSLASDQITLTAGTYHIRVIAPAHGVGRHQARLQNVTDTATVLTGTSQFTNNTSVSSSVSEVVGVFTIAASKALEVQHQCQVTLATFGFGVEANFTTEVYTVVELWKLQ